MIHFKVFLVDTDEVVLETYNEKTALTYLKIFNLKGERLYDYQWYEGEIRSNKL